MLAALELTKLEGIIPALESAHALAVLPKLNLRPDQVVVVNLSGRGDKDLEAYIENVQIDDKVTVLAIKGVKLVVRKN